MTGLLRDLTDAEARRGLVLKWGSVDPDVLPAWVAEMDYALAPVVADALREAIDTGVTGYQAFESGGELGAAYAGFAQRQFGQEVDPELVIPTVDVTAGVRIALDVLSDKGPIVMPVPAARRSSGSPTSPVARASTWWSTRTPNAPSSTSTGWTTISPRVRAPCS